MKSVTFFFDGSEELLEEECDGKDRKAAGAFFYTYHKAPHGHFRRLKRFGS